MRRPAKTASKVKGAGMIPQPGKANPRPGSQLNKGQKTGLAASRANASQGKLQAREIDKGARRKQTALTPVEVRYADPDLIRNLSGSHQSKSVSCKENMKSGCGRRRVSFRI